MKKISVLIPCYNEEKTLPLLYPELVKLMEGLPDYEWEIMFVNDGSADNTLHILQQLRQQDKRVNYVDLSRNFGKEVAMLAGFDYVTGDCMVIVDADLQDPPALIPEMLKYWEEGYEDVYARRRTRGKESWLRKWLSIKFYKLLQRTSRFDVLQNVGDFRLLDRRCINALKRMRESERYTKGMFCWIGFNKKEVEFDRGDRVAGHSSWGYKQLFSLAIDGITSFTSAPLRISTFVGFVVSPRWSCSSCSWAASNCCRWASSANTSAASTTKPRTGPTTSCASSTVFPTWGTNTRTDKERTTDRNGIIFGKIFAGLCRKV